MSLITESAISHCKPTTARLSSIAVSGKRPRKQQINISSANKHTHTHTRTHTHTYIPSFPFCKPLKVKNYQNINKFPSVCTCGHMHVHTHTHTHSEECCCSWRLMMNSTRSQRSNVKQAKGMFTVQLCLNPVCAKMSLTTMHTIQCVCVCVCLCMRECGHMYVCLLLVRRRRRGGSRWINEENMEKKKHSDPLFSLWSAYDLLILRYFSLCGKFMLQSTYPW